MFIFIFKKRYDTKNKKILFGEKINDGSIFFQEEKEVLRWDERTNVLVI